ncbi:DUF2235 domain-containing protein [Novosphingobium sp.]|uniref:DUF2235 domain-containing protein n=1 Tax=Novosphingobium sp. TaxID=1874826 RepID=UPI0038BC5523
MSRNIVLCCDGTANSFSPDRTNVLKLASAMVKDHDRQAVYYHPGLGTRAPVGTGTAVGGTWAKVKGLALGAGFQDDVTDGYIYLMNHFRAGDRLFILGFSRGAYTARAIAGMLKLYGLIMPGNEALVPYAVQMMWDIAGADGAAKAKQGFRLAADFRKTLAATECKPHFLGVWDTVDSVGWTSHPLALPYTRHNPDVAHTRHAVAIDERRAFYRLNWFAEEQPNLKLVWFPGVHCDVGGGYPEAESGLSKYPLEWMAEEAAAQGLLLDPEKLAEVLGKRGGDFAPPAPGPAHESLKGAWKLAELIPKARYNRTLGKLEQRANHSRRRTMPDGSVVHDVAWSMPGTYTQRLPKGAVKLSEMHWGF